MPSVNTPDFLDGWSMQQWVGWTVRDTGLGSGQAEEVVWQGLCGMSIPWRVLRKTKRLQTPQH